MTEDTEPSVRALAELIARIAGAIHAGGDDATARTQAAADVDRLQALVGWDPAREDAAKRAQYRREARAALDEIFADKPENP